MKAEVKKVKQCSIVDKQHYCKMAEEDSKLNGSFYSN